jgi:hypothetical protein
MPRLGVSREGSAAAGFRIVGMAADAHQGKLAHGGLSEGQRWYRGA